MRLGELLDEATILTGLKAKDRWVAIPAIVDALVASGRLDVSLRRAVVDALVAREKIASTGMEHSVALPHASVDGLNSALAALAIAPEGVAFQSADGRPAHLIVLLVIPRRQIQQYIRTLAGIARLFTNETVRTTLVQAKDAKEALRIIHEGEQEEEL